jgi:hypothetical protein
MSMMPVLIVVSMLGVKWGWEPVAGGGVEYIIRIEPHAIEALRSGRDIFSDLPPQIQRVRSYRITVGNDPVPHEGELPPANFLDARPPTKSDAAGQSARVPPSGVATAARQPVDDADTPPPAAGQPFAETPLGEQPPPTFQPPAAPPAEGAPPAMTGENSGNPRREWPRRGEGAAGMAPSLAPPPGSNPGISNLGPPETGAPANASGPTLQPPAGTWPNRPAYEQPQGGAGLPTRPPSGFGPTTQAEEQPAQKGEWFDPPTAGQPARNGYPARSQSGQAPNGQSQYGERDLFGRPTNVSPSFSTPAKHSNTSLAQNLAAAEERGVAEVQSKPWLLVVTLLILFASVGLNVYLGMIAWDLYERYRTTIEQLKSATEARVA